MDLTPNFSLFSKKKNKNIPSSLRVGNELINNLKPLGGIFKPGVTKAGRISLLGTLANGSKVKIYQAFNENQIKLRKELGEKLKREDVLLPKVILSDEDFIVEEWILGKTFDKLKINSIDKYSLKLIKFFEMIHFDKVFIDIAKTTGNSFCYLSDYLLIRLNPWKKWLPVEELLIKWQASNKETEDLLESRISHPDISLSNLILDKNEKIYIIDNELIGSGKGWILDEKNSFFRNKIANPSFSPAVRNFYDLSWKLRLVGSALDSGDFSRAERMAYLKYK